MEPAPTLPLRLRALRDEPFRSYALVIFMISSALLLEAHAANLYWDKDGDGAGTGGTGNWDTSSAWWRLEGITGPLLPWPGDGTDLTANLTGTGGTLTVTSQIGVNNILAGSSFTISGTAGSLSLEGSSVPILDVAATQTLEVSSSLHSTAGFIKSGAGKLIIDARENNVTGGILLNGGTLQLGSTGNNSALLTLRSTSIHLATGTTLTAGGTSTSARIGNLTGTGTVEMDRTLYLQSLGPANPFSPGSAITHFNSGSVFSGKIKAPSLVLSGTGSNLVQLPGGVNVSMQTFNGHTSEIASAVTINSGAGLTLTGRENPLFPGTTADIGSIGATAITLRGGALVLDNSTGNASSGRVRTTVQLSFSSGVLVLTGSTVESLQYTGKATFHSGANTIAVIHKGAPAGTILTLSGGERSTSSRSTIDFRGEGGTLGVGSGNPRITFGDAAASVLGPWATVNGGDYAQHSANGIVAAAPTTFISPITSVGNATRYYQVTGSAERSGTSLLSAAGIRLNPTGPNQSLTITSAGNIQTTGLLLAGNHDYTITSPGGGGFTSTGGAARYIGVAEPGTTLTIGAKFMSPGHDIVKFGQGFLDLTGDNTGTLNSGHTSFVLNQGTLRATLGTSNASLPTNGTTSVAFRGGVLEIANGNGSGTATAADFQFSLGSGAGKVNWATSNDDRGDGGFSAFGADATVNIGGATTPSTLTWNDTYFVRSGNALTFGSTKADRRVTVLNPLQLDSASESGIYNAREIRVFKNPDPSVTTDAARLSGTISGSANSDLMKTGPGVLQLTGNNTFTGNTIVQSGTLQLGASDGAGAGASGALGGTGKIIVNSTLTPTGNGAALSATDRGTLLLAGDPQVFDRINDNAELVLAGGVFDTNGRSETLGALTLLHVESILDFGLTPDGLLQSVLRFADSSANVWTGELRIWNYTAGKDRLFFGDNSSGLRPDQLPQIRFYSDNGYTPLGSASITENGEIITPVPEPSTILYATAVLGFLGWRERRRMIGMIGRRAR